ncbi:c-type cytochrome biogenesis protein CcmI [Rhizobium sp. CFBP 8762]|nr:c-type cytochrome biogenesis protein CcmI [Rhizobium sp. CFBP 8762]
MLFWILVAILTAAVAVFLLMPLWTRRDDVAAGDGYDAEVYRDQLAELTRDQAAGIISEPDAQAARTEVSRRLLKASEDMTPRVRGGGRGWNRVAQALVLICLPAIGLCLYLTTGSPGVPAAPLAARLAEPAGTDINIMIARVESHLAQKPDDGKGWAVLAPIYMRNGRMEEAARAYANAGRLLGETPEQLGGFAEATIAVNDGIVTGDAVQALQKALVMDRNDPRARYFLALALKQGGESAKARVAFDTILASSPADAPWVPLVREQLAGLESGPTVGAAASKTGPDLQDVAAAQSLSTTERSDMIAGMVDGLDAKLRAQPDDIEGWLRLVRSRLVLNQRGQAVDALERGLQAFPNDGAERQQLKMLGVELKLTPADRQADGRPDNSEEPAIGPVLNPGVGLGVPGLAVPGVGSLSNAQGTNGQGMAVQDQIIHSLGLQDEGSRTMGVKPIGVQRSSVPLFDPSNVTTFDAQDGLSSGGTVN